MNVSSFKGCSFAGIWEKSEKMKAGRRTFSVKNWLISSEISRPLFRDYLFGVMLFPFNLGYR